jgi:hypothetical protein
MALIVGLNIFFMNFGFPIDPLGLGVMRKDIILENRIKGGIFDGFGNQDIDGVNRVFIKSFVSGGKKLEQFRIIIIGIHNDSGITFFFIFEDKDIRVIFKQTNGGDLFFN